MTRNCQHCKTSFAATRLNQFYCKQSCRQGAYLIRNGIGSGKNISATENNSQGINVANLLNNIQPEMLMQLLSGFAKNPSMTDNVTDKKGEAPVNKGNSPENPSQFVNDGFKFTDVNSNKFVQNQCGNNLKSVNDEYEKGIKKNGGSVFNFMFRHGLTLEIPPKGYVRSLLPHWDEKEWKLSLVANQKMLKLFSRLQKASRKDVISILELNECNEQIKELRDGFYGIYLPEDYPFKLFILFLSEKIESLLARASGKTQIKFGIPEDLDEMMMILNVQLRTDE